MQRDPGSPESRWRAAGSTATCGIIALVFGVAVGVIIWWLG